MIEYNLKNAIIITMKVSYSIILLSLIPCLYSVAISYDYKNSESQYSSKSDSLVVQKQDYESQNTNDLSPLNTFLYPSENVKLKPPFIKKINVFWEAVWVGHIDKPRHKMYNSIVFTPIAAQIILEGPNFAFHIKVMPYIAYSSDQEQSFVGEEMYFTGEGKYILAINPNIDFYFRFLNLREDQVLWVGGGLHSIYPVFETLLNIPVRKYRLQTGGGLIFCYGGNYGDSENLYMFSFNLETSPLYNSRYLWGINGGIMIPFNLGVKNSWNKHNVDIWIGGTYGIF